VEDDAGRGGVCDQATLVVDNPPLGGRRGAADVDGSAGRGQSATIGRDRADVVDLRCNSKIAELTINRESPCDAGGIATRSSIRVTVNEISDLMLVRN
jgi:hypothetical protein